jgi:hypothetical protein
MSNQDNRKLLVAGLLLAGLLVLPSAATGATVSTDKADYAPDDVVVICYSGFDDSSVITVRIDGPVDSDWGFDEFTSDSPSEWVIDWAFDNESGAYRIDYDKGLCEGMFTVTVSDETGTMAVATFTDTAPVQVDTITTLNTISSPLTSGQTGVSYSGQVSASPAVPNGQTVQLQISSDNVNFSTITTATTTGGVGSFSGTFTAPTVSSSTTYYFRAHFPATGNIGGYNWKQSQSDSREVTVNAAATPSVDTTLTLTIEPIEVILGCEGPVELTATLTRDDTSAGVVGVTVGFSVDGSSVGSATTGSGGIATINYDPSSLGVGSHEVQASFAGTTTGSPLFNASESDVVSLNVIYSFIGLLSPYQAPPRAYKINSSIPLKWQYGNCANEAVDSSAANPSIDIQFVGAEGNSNGEAIDLEDPGSSGLRYDTLTMTWQYNWQTKNRLAGWYAISITSGQTGQTNGSFLILLRK